ncbi:MAG: CBS domain-containing protein [Planctomycetota bacterium]
MLPARNSSVSAGSALATPVLHGLRMVQTAVNQNQTIREALADLRMRAIDHPVVYVYAVDDDDRLVGQVPTKALLFSSPDALVRDVMRTELTTIGLEMSMDQALEVFAKRRLLALPVVDGDGRLIGAIDVEQYARERLEKAERARVRQVFQTLGLDVEHADDLTPWEGFRMRMPWLLCNIGGGILCAIVAWMFGELLEKVVLLAFFLPLVLTLGESVAMQAVTISVGMDPERRSSAALRGMRVEAMTAVLLGIVSGAIVAGVSLLWGGGAEGALTMFAAVAGSMVFAAVAGGSIPLALHAFRLDPSVAAGPVALVLADTATTAIYFTLGMLILMPSA